MVSLDERFTQALHGGARAWRGAIERQLVVPTARGKALAAEIDDFTAALRREVMARIDSARLDVAAGVLEALRALLEGA
ncbi:MAG TPA: hypothetical protein VF793_08505 [Telluria sp.]|jgi:hypothetical protein